MLSPGSKGHFRCGVRRASPELLLVERGNSVTLMCTVFVPLHSGNPTWEPNIGGSSSLAISEGRCEKKIQLMTGTISNITEAETGKYTCSIACQRTKQSAPKDKKASIHVYLYKQSEFCANIVPSIQLMVYSANYLTITSAEVQVNSGGYLPNRFGKVNIHRYSPTLRRIIVLIYTTQV